jgi:tRNA(Ile)-lysidine synthase
MPVRLDITSLDPRRKYLVGVSGGRDSVALLHLLRERSFKRLIVCHLDHGLRSRASAADARSVRRLAEKFNLPFEFARANTRSFAATHKLSLETAARELRYAFFAAIARGRRCPRLILAHHADDQVETIFFNFLRGTGAAGLAGMRMVSTRAIAGVTLDIHRPLLAATRAEIDAFLSARKIRFRDDASNADPVHSRSRLRHRVLPVIEREFGTTFRGAILRGAEIFRAENDFLERAAADFEITPQLPIRKLRELHPALLRRILKRWLDQNLPDIGFAEVERVASLLAPGARTAKVNLPGGLHCRRRAAVLFLE